MTIEEIRKGAPDGATHYYLDEDGNVFYYKYDGDNKSLQHFTSLSSWVFCHDPQQAFELRFYSAIKPL